MQVLDVAGAGGVFRVTVETPWTRKHLNLLTAPVFTDSGMD